MNIGLLFDTSGFPPRWFCGSWSPLLGWTHIAADVAIGLAYTAIPIVLGRFTFRRPDLAFRPLFWLFCAFIFACGATHLIEATIFWHPVYRLSAVAKVMTALVSLGTVAALLRYAPVASRLPHLGQLRAIVESTDDAIVACDRTGRILTWNPGAERVYGHAADDVIGRPRDLIDPSGSMNVDDVWAGRSVPPFEAVHRRADGADVAVSVSLAPVVDGSDRVVGASSIARDISERKRAEAHLVALSAELERQAFLDPLTELENRRGLERHLERVVDARHRTGEGAVAILVDLDDFKRVNDAFGHAGGDAVLKRTAEQLSASVRPSDIVTRVGGDEFLVILPATRIAEGRRVAERMRLGVSDTPVRLGDREWRVTASLGYAVVPDGAISVEALLDALRYGLVGSKKRGKNRVTEAGGGASADDATAVQRVLDPAGLSIHAQAVHRVADGSVCGYEFLVRGPHGPYRSPDDLFRLSIENDVLVSFDLACLRLGFEAARSIDAQFVVHLNVFPSTLLDVPVARLVELAGPAGGPARFCLELSEKQFLGDPSALREVVGELQGAGFRVAIDDVGAGHSALESLVVLEPDVVKVDRSFVSGAAESPSARRRLARLVRSCASLADVLVVEGVETEAERRLVVELGVEEAQGFLWGRPVPVGERARS